MQCVSLVTGQGALTFGGGPCPDREYLFTSNNTCLNCPFTCQSCLSDTSDRHNPCINCNSGFGFSRSPTSQFVSETAGGKCVPCSIILKVTSEGTRRLALYVPDANQQLEGRVEVFYSGKWWSVCDDLWTDTNTNVICRELDMGHGVEFYKNYDTLYSGVLPARDVIFDDIQCLPGDTSLFQCQRLPAWSHSCSRTETVGVRCSGPENRRRCVADSECPVGQYADNTTKVCMQCVEGCLQCERRANTCKMCEEPFFLLMNETCTRECPRGHYGNTRLRTCARCSPSCQTCSTGKRNDVCLTCHKGEVLFHTECLTTCPVNSFSMQASRDAPVLCVERCPDGFYHGQRQCVECDSTCMTCTGQSDNCTSCVTGDVLSRRSASGKCRSSCGQGYFPSVEAVCEQCRDPNCQVCLVGGLYCDTCQPGFLLQFAQCVEECSFGFYKGSGTCLDNCPVGQYGNQDSGKCEPCHAQCRRCQGAGTESCLSCSTGYYLAAGGGCVRDCGDNAVATSSGQTGNVRLMGGTTSLEGRVEIFHQGKSGMSLTLQFIFCMWF